MQSKPNALPTPSALSVKGVKSFRGMEGYGFNANLYFQGKKVALAMDEANGGCFRYEWEGKTFEERSANEKRVMDYIAALPPEKKTDKTDELEACLFDENGERKLDLDEVVANLVADFEELALVKRLCKKKIVLKEGKDIFTISQPYDPEFDAGLAKRYPNAEIVNKRFL